jgi:hypothetical protein
LGHNALPFFDRSQSMIANCYDASVAGSPAWMMLLVHLSLCAQNDRNSTLFDWYFGKANSLSLSKSRLNENCHAEWRIKLEDQIQEEGTRPKKDRCIKTEGGSMMRSRDRAQHDRQMQLTIRAPTRLLYVRKAVKKCKNWERRDTSTVLFRIWQIAKR